MRFTADEMDLPDEYPPLNDGSTVPFTPSGRPRGTAADRARILGKHRPGANQSRKTMFPAGWSGDEIMDAIDLTLADPVCLHRSGDKITFERAVNGERVRVHVRVDEHPPRLRTAYPPSGTLPV